MLYAYNKTTSALALDIGTYGATPATSTQGEVLGKHKASDIPPVLPASTVLGQRGGGVDVTAFMENRTAAQYQAAQALVAAGSVDFAWSTHESEYLTPGLTVYPVWIISRVESRHALLYGVAAVTTDGTVATAALPANGVAMTLNANSIDRARKLNITTATTGNGAGSVLALVGKDINGNAVSESVACATSGTVSTVHAYRTLTSATPTITGTAQGTVKIDLGGAIALPTNKTPTATDFAVTAEADAGANVTVGTVDTVAQTIVPTTTLGPTVYFEFDYNFTVTAK